MPGLPYPRSDISMLEIGCQLGFLMSVTEWPNKRSKWWWWWYFPYKNFFVVSVLKLIVWEFSQFFLFYLYADYSKLTHSLTDSLYFTHGTRLW